ncbi:hypothetical protein ACVWZV_005090 [Bradyrhizobium sp. GM5.1]
MSSVLVSFIAQAHGEELRGRHATGGQSTSWQIVFCVASARRIARDIRGQNSLGSTYNLLALAAADEIQTAKSSIEVQIYTNQTRHQHIAPHDEFPVCYRLNRRATIRMIIPGAVNRRDTIVD